MTQDTTQEQLAELTKKVDQLIANQQSLEGLLHIIGRQVHIKDGTSPDAFEELAKGWKVNS